MASNIMFEVNKLFIIIDFDSARLKNQSTTSCTPEMGIECAHPSTSYDVACLMTTLLQIMTSTSITYNIKEAVLRDINLYANRYPTLCRILLQLHLCEEIEIETFRVLCTDLFQQAMTIKNINHVVLKRANIFG